MGTKSSLKDGLQRLRKFITEDVWDIELGSLSKARSFRIKSARIVYLVLKGFRDDECPLHASALTFSTLMSIVPILAISLAVVRGLDGSEPVKKWVTGSVAEWTEGFESAAVPVEGEGNQAGTVDSVAKEDSYRIGPAIEQLTEDMFKKVENVSFTALGGAGVVWLIWRGVQGLGRVE